MDTIEGNKLIWRFMNRSLNDARYTMPELMQYDVSWDWLMPVVEKIDTLTCEVSLSCISFNRCTIDYFEGEISFEGLGDSRIEATWNCVCEFITWYNENK